MNKNSVICNFIKNNENWQELLESMNVKVKIEGSLAIFSYDIMADFTNSVVQEARGIIIDLSTLDVVCWPFRKFGNHTESYADSIDWSTARVQEKIDGSIIKLYFYNDQWNWATNNTINAEDTKANNVTGSSFADLIRKAVNYSNIKFDELDTQKTYIFELVSPENQIVIKYNDYKLYHTGTRNNITGEESIENIGIEHPYEYPLTTFEECLEAVNKLNIDDNVEHEGFVVVDNNWHRIKIKSMTYITLHHLVTNQVSKKNILEYILEDNDLEAVKEYPQYAVFFSFYKYKLDEFIFNIDRFILAVRKLYEEYSFDRKAVALTIKNHKYAAFGFKSLGNNLSANELVKKLTINQLADYIPDYVVEEITF